MSGRFALPILDTVEQLDWRMTCGRMEMIGDTDPHRLVKGDLSAELPDSWYDSDQMAVRFRGTFTVEGADRQGENLLQEGLDWSYFERNGYFNYEHQHGFDNMVGVPIAGTLAPVTLPDGSMATRGEGWLLLGTPKGAEIYKLAKSLALAKASGVDTGRQIGFSIEGKALERDKDNPKIVKRARVYHVSFVLHPIQSPSRLELIKGSDFVGYQTPAAAGTAAGNLAMLYPQSIDGDVNEILYGKDKKKHPKGWTTVSRIESELRKAFPRMPDGPLLKATRKLAEHLRKQGLTVENS